MNLNNLAAILHRRGRLQDAAPTLDDIAVVNHTAVLQAIAERAGS